MSVSHNAAAGAAKSNDPGRRRTLLDRLPGPTNLKLALVYSIALVCIFANLSMLTYTGTSQPAIVYTTQARAAPDASSLSLTNLAADRPRIALFSSFVPEPRSDGKMSKLNMLDHIINKACYAHIWGYDYILNMTPGFSEKEKTDSPWLQFGCWNRVPQMQAQLDNYDWLLYADIDWIVRDMSRPLESFLKEFELYNKTPSIFLPTDGKDGYYTFSSYTQMIKNTAFGHAVLDNWMRFGHGLCPKGNFPMQWQKDGKPKYEWYYGDQAGLWWSLVKSYEDFYHTGLMKETCSNETGYIDTDRFYGPETNQFFKKLKLALGHDGKDLHAANNDIQPIIWSTAKTAQPSHAWSGLGMQMNFAMSSTDERLRHAFALHQKNGMSEDFYLEADMCKRVHGCYARYRDKDGDEDILEIGCGNNTMTVVQ